MALDQTPERSFDGWAAPEGFGVPPITVSDHKPNPQRWLLLGRPDAGGLSVSEIAANLEVHRGYCDRRAQGGGLALFLSGVLLGLQLRHLAGVPVPVLDPDATWVEINERGNLLRVIAVGEPPVAMMSMNELAALAHRLFDPVVAAIHACTKFPLVSQWNQFTSCVADVLLTGAVVEETRALDYLAQMADADPVWRKARPRLRTLPWQGGERTYAVRRVCCFNYLGAGSTYCGSMCPLVDKDERDAYARHVWEFGPED